MKKLTPWGLGGIMAIASVPAVSTYGILSAIYDTEIHQKKMEATQKHKERIDTILRLNTIEDENLNPLSKDDCKLLNGVPVLNELIRKGVDEIILKTNAQGIYWDSEKGGTKSNDYRSSSYGDVEKSTFDKRHLAVSYRMKGTHEWQAFTQEQVKRIFIETDYTIFFPSKDGACAYNSISTEWQPVNLIGIPSSPSEELTENLNEGQIRPITRRVIGR